MTAPSVELVCAVCGREAIVGADTPAEGVISFPTFHCSTCPGYPQLVTRDIRPRPNATQEP
jgi:hypothetical protein